MIPFNKPYLTGRELEYIKEAVYSGKISGNGKYTQKCQDFFEKQYGFGKCLLTTSCTDALEMAAILIDIKPGDEVIVPSYTFVSTANAFVLRGAKIIFCDSRVDHPGMDENLIESLISNKTKAIVAVHYAGVACDMDLIMEIANRNNLFVVEDAAQAIDSFYFDNKGVKRPLGSIGHFAAFSFHETKNVISGEGGMLVINDSKYFERAEIIWEKGTNRTKFHKGEVDKYSWVDVGSSFLPSEIIAAFLFSQLENIENIQSKRLSLWNKYNQNIINNKLFNKPKIPSYATNNSHMYYLVLDPLKRDLFIDFMKKNGVLTVFHYLNLEESEFSKKHFTSELQVISYEFSNSLVRLPLFYELDDIDQVFIIQKINDFFQFFYG